MNNNRIIIALVEDEPDHSDLIIAAFDDDEKYEFNVFVTIKSAKEYLQFNTPDILITDWKLPDGEGLELISKLESVNYPIIVMTSFGNEKFAVSAMKKGATDYIVKSSHSFQNMPHTVDRAIRESVLLREKKIAEELRFELDSRFKAFFENASVGMSLVSLDNKFILLNDILYKILNYEKGELLDSNLLLHLYPDDVTPVFSAFNDLITGESDNSHLEIRFIAKKGNYIWADLNIALIRDGKAKPTYFTFVVQDVTERKKAESEVLKLNEELERKVTDRTFQLNRTLEELTQSNEELRILNTAVADESIKLLKLNEKLAVSENNLIEALNTKNKFFSIIAHDLRNPIGYFSQITETLNLYHQNMTEDELRKLFSMMEKSAKYTLDLLNNLLEWAQAQTGNIKFRPSICNLFELVNQACSIHKLNAEKKNIDLVIRVEKDLMVKCDSSMIQTIIRNLVSNSIKYTNTKGRIEVKSYVSNDSINLIVSDNGIGMTPENKNKLFKIGSHISTKGTENEIGAGLGLILCKEFLDMHNAKIRIESEIGKGTSFDLAFPRDFD